jgi:hypothetical protein
MAGLRCKYGNVLAFIGCFSFTMVVITGRTMGSLITFAASASNRRLMEMLLWTPLRFG